MKRSIYKPLSDESVAAFLDGCTAGDETLLIIDGIIADGELREVLDIARAVDEDLTGTSDSGNVLPVTAMAAFTDDGNICNLRCEMFILHRRGIHCDADAAYSTARDSGWLNDAGTPLYNIGRLLEHCGLYVSRQYDCTVDDIREALAAGRDVIAVVDGGELTDATGAEIVEDITVGEIPDHAVVILDCNDTEVTVYNPDAGNESETYPVGLFADAWADSKNYLVIVNDNDMENYVPHPIDLSDVELTEDLMELREAIAENAHEVWAANRRQEGWTYGPRRNDTLKQTPDMVPYSKLTDSEKHYDREMAMNTIKLLKKLGYDLVKKS